LLGDRVSLSFVYVSARTDLCMSLDSKSQARPRLVEDGTRRRRRGDGRSARWSSTCTLTFSSRG